MRNMRMSLSARPYYFLGDIAEVSNASFLLYTRRMNPSRASDPWEVMNQAGLVYSHVESLIGRISPIHECCGDGLAK